MQCTLRKTKKKCFTLWVQNVNLHQKKQRSLKLLKKIASKKTLHKPLICLEKTSHYAAFFYALYLSPYISENIKNRFNIPNCSKFHVAD
ncbi:hypothetical protein THOA03_60094 [Vibrio owensii]|nr:hypothetical protein THOA03_60094 [Vibrio owensii]